MIAKIYLLNYMNDNILCSVDCKAIIQKHSKDFGSSIEDPEVIKLRGGSRNSYYKYKKKIKAGKEVL